jgi:ferritin heavy chain
MSTDKKNEGQPDRQKAPVASNQPRENLVRLYVFFKNYIFVFFYNYYSFSNYHEDNEGLINRQINLELYASYVYTALSHHFERHDVALKGKKNFRINKSYLKVFVQVIIYISKKWLKKKVNMQINLWNIKINEVVQLFFWMLKYVDIYIFFCYI